MKLKYWIFVLLLFIFWGTRLISPIKLNKFVNYYELVSLGDLYVQIGTRAQTTDAKNLVVGYFIKHGTVRTLARSLSLENSQHPNAIGIHNFRRNYIKALM